MITKQKCDANRFISNRANSALELQKLGFENKLKSNDFSTGFRDLNITIINSISK